MRILQVVHGFPPEGVAGTERYCEALSRGLLRRGHACMVLAGSERCAPEATLATVEQGGLPVTRYLRAWARPRLWTDEYDPEAEILTGHLLDLVRPEVVHVHHWQRLTNNLVMICADRKVPVVVTMHDPWTSCPRIHRIRWDGAFCAERPAAAPCLTCAERNPWQGDQEIGRALSLRREMVGLELARAVRIIAPSQAHRAFLLGLLELPEDRLVVLPHGWLRTVTARQRREQRSELAGGPLRIGHWGYLMYLKGTHLILEAVHQLRDPSAVQVHLIGLATEPDYEERLRELARGISVEFHGPYRPADLRAFDLDIAVFASIASESHSFALDEALRLGLPILAPDRGAFPERLGAAGLMFQAGDARDLARRLQAILDAPDVLDRMRRSVRTAAVLSMEAHVTMIEKIYDDAASEKKPKRTPSTPYLKLIAQVREQVGEREAALAGLQERLTQSEQREAAAEAVATAQIQQREEERARLQADLDRVTQELAAEAQARQAADAGSTEVQARLAAAEAQRVGLVEQLAALGQARISQTRELERLIARLREEYAALAQRLIELERTPAGRLQAWLKRLDRPKRTE
ncbi:MAG: glycosyltransferase [Candidatus Methylomirabilis oxyfera]|nr:glycosyltransferase [Candidatus Methylomirabilis oxyfera]